MAQRKILLDTCSYLRLAETLHPLLGVEFGQDRSCLYVIKEFQGEYDGQPRLQRKYPSLADDEYRENRKKKIVLSKKELSQITHVVETFDDFAFDNELSPSPVDLKALATAYLNKIELVTDDTDLAAVAAEFGVPVMRTMQLLKFMLDTGHIALEKVRSCIEYMQYLPDKPAYFAQDQLQYFPELDSN